MDVEVRFIEEHEADAWITGAQRVFFVPTMPSDQLALEQSVLEVDRAIGAFDGDELVGTTGSYRFSMIVPGGADVPVAGVTMVTVAPTHRRRGILTEMMRLQLDDVVERGERIAILNASEALIYDRFGYGPAVDAVTFEIDTRASQFRAPLDDHGSFELVDRASCHQLLADIYDRFRPLRAGSLTRSDTWWRAVLGPIEGWRGGGDQYVVVHRAADGTPDGFALYVVRGHGEHGIQLATVETRDIVGLNTEIEAALWRFCLDIDLSTRLVATGRPVDEPIRWRLLEPRQLRTTERIDLLWVRLVDVAGALDDRRYAVEGSLVIDVADPFLPQNDRAFSLEGGPEGASCRSTTRSPDLRIDIGGLGAAYLGGVSFSTLAAGGRVIEHSRGAVQRAHAMFATHAAPHCTTRF